MSDKEEILTERLRLRPYFADDAERLVLHLNDRGIAKWIPTIPHPYTLEDAQAFLGLDDPFPNRAVIEQDGKLIGGVAIGKELGYWLAPAARGKGFAAEASRAMMALHFEKPDNKHLLSSHLLGNEPSRAVLDALGFEQVGLQEVKSLSLKLELDSVLMQLTRTAWKARK